MSWNPTLDPVCPDAVGVDAIETLIIPRSRDLGGFEVRRALRRSFRRACIGRRQCAGRTAAVQRHAWRGRVRILLLQSQLLEQRGLVAATPELKRLAQNLGNENDLALVSRVLGPLGLSERAKTALRAYVQQQRRALAKRNDARAAALLRLKLQPRLRPADERRRRGTQLSS